MGIHDGHRGRLKERYIKEGGEHFAAHNLLELLLFYAIPRKDTNETAHLLLQRFGDVYGVLTAPVEELCKVKGVSESTAALIRLTGELGGRFYRDETASLLRFYTFDDMGKFLVRQYKGVRDERVMGLFLTSKGMLLKKAVICNGNVSSVNLHPRDIVATALGCNAAAVVIAHNHPGGRAFPSSEDLSATAAIYSALNVNGLELVDHYIVAGSSYCRILSESLGKAESGQLRQKFGV